MKLKGTVSRGRLLRKDDIWKIDGHLGPSEKRRMYFIVIVNIICKNRGCESLGFVWGVAHSPYD